MYTLVKSVSSSGAGAVPVRLDITSSGFQITPDALAACITPKTKASVLNSPNNPTGVVLDGCGDLRKPALSRGEDKVLGDSCRWGALALNVFLNVSSLSL